MAGEGPTKRVRVITEYNPRTGEEQSYVDVPVPLRRRRARDFRSKEAFVRTYPRLLENLIELDLNGTEWKVFFALMQVMGFEKPFVYSNKDLAARCKITPSRASAVVRILKERGLVIEFPDRKILLDPSVVWFGHDDTRMQMIWFLEEREKDDDQNRTAAP